MMISGDVRYFHGGRSIRLDSDEAGKAVGNDSLKGAIPPRYRDGLGGIDSEQVKQDQRRARRRVVRAMIRSFGQIRRRR